MKPEAPKQIKFRNRKTPLSQFDMVDLQDLFRMELDDDIEQIHRIEFYHILIVTQGKGQHTVDFTDYDYQRGSVITVRKDQVHKFCRSKARGVVLLFTEEFVISQLEELEVLKTFQLFNDLLSAPRLYLNDDELKGIVELTEAIRTEYFKVNDKHSAGIIRSLVHVLITKLYRIKSEYDSALEDRKYLGQFIQLQKWIEIECFKTRRAADYATMMGVTTKTLNNITRSICDKSTKEFIDEIVVIRIKRLLINTVLTVKEIAYEAGFDEPTNMYKYFKRQVGMSPESFRHTRK